MELNTMTVDALLADIASRPGFAEQVGMVLTHCGVVRGRSRDGRPVTALRVKNRPARLDALCAEYRSRPGIFAVEARASEGLLHPGEPLLLLAVAGDVRETVIATLAELLDRVKAEAVEKEELHV